MRKIGKLAIIVGILISVLCLVPQSVSADFEDINDDHPAPQGS